MTNYENHPQWGEALSLVHALSGIEGQTGATRDAMCSMAARRLIDFVKVAPHRDLADTYAAPDWDALTRKIWEAPAIAPVSDEMRAAAARAATTAGRVDYGAPRHDISRVDYGTPPTEAVHFTITPDGDNVVVGVTTADVRPQFSTEAMVRARERAAYVRGARGRSAYASVGADDVVFVGPTGQKGLAKADAAARFLYPDPA